MWVSISAHEEEGWRKEEKAFSSFFPVFSATQAELKLQKMSNLGLKHERSMRTAQQLPVAQGCSKTLGQLCAPGKVSVVQLGGLQTTSTSCAGKALLGEPLDQGGETTTVGFSKSLRTEGSLISLRLIRVLFLVSVESSLLVVEAGRVCMGTVYTGWDASGQAGCAVCRIPALPGNLALIKPTKLVLTSDTISGLCGLCGPSQTALCLLSSSPQAPGNVSKCQAHEWKRRIGPSAGNAGNSGARRLVFAK